MNGLIQCSSKCLKNRFSVAPGDAQSYKLYVTNYGNHDDDISLNITNIPEAWDISFLPYNMLEQTITLGPFNSTTIQVKVITDSKSLQKIL